MTQIKECTQMDDLYDRLAAIGLPKKYIKENALPNWWCEEYEEESDAIVTAASYISKLLNLDFKSLLDNTVQPKLILTSQPKFKVQKGSDLEQLPVASTIAAKVASVLAYGCQSPYRPIAGLTAANIRQEILSSRRSVDLEGLLDFCWSYGIPVVHFSRFPSGSRKFQGMSACFRQRPVIVLSLNSASPSRLLFILAHELGHILKGHLNLSSENVLVDEKVVLESIDEEEIEANEVAIELITGYPDRSYCPARNYNAKQLAIYAKQVGERDRVSPGVVALNYGWAKNHWGSTTDALKILEPNANAPLKINQYVQGHLDWDRLGHDYQDYLELVLGLESELEMR